MEKIEKGKKVALYILAVVGALALLTTFFGFPSVFDLSGGMASQTFNMGAKGAPSLISPSPMYESASDAQYKTNPASSDETRTSSKIETKKIIKNGSLDILVNKTEDTIQRITDLAKSKNGFIEGSEVYKSTEDTKSGYVTVRVPATKFEETISEIKTFAEIVEREQVTAQDVTESYVDMEARLKNLKAEEAQYLVVLKKAVTIKDILAVQKELGYVREDIERLQGQLQFLGRQTEMSTITVNITSKADVTIFGIYWKPFSVITQSLHNLFLGLTDYIDSMISFLLGLPVLILWFLTYAFFGILAWKILKLIWTRFVKESAPVGRGK